jgi:uncharacterized cupin superfamily protein
MIMPSLVFSKTAVDLKPAPIQPEWVLAGTPTASNAVVAVSRDGLAKTIVWHCTEGSFRWIYDVDETIHILEGAVTLTCEDGSVREIGPGDIVFFPEGSTAVWRVTKPVRKLAFFRYTAPTPVAFAIKATHRLLALIVAAARKAFRRPA